MYYTEQQKKKQEILQRLKNQQQLSEQRARQEEFGLDDFLKAGNGINTASKHASNVGKYLSKSNNSLVSNFGEKLNTIGNYGQKMTGEGVKQSISNALKSKLGLGAKASTPAVNSAISSTVPSAASTAGTIGSGATSAGLTGASVGTGAATGATGSALGSAIGAEVAGTAGAAGSSALGSAISAAAPSAASAVGAGAAGAAGAGAAGAGAAGAGAAAAGAGAAGAGAGAAALGALGPVGAALAAGYMIYNMIKSAKKKQQAKQMQVSAQAAQDNMQQAAAKKAEAMQSLQPQVAQPQQVPSYIPEASTKEEVVEPQLEQPVEEETSPLDMLTEGLTPDGETSDTGELTGMAAAPVDLEATKTSLMDKLRTGVGNISNASQSGLDRLASGLNDFAAGYKDNATTSITEGDLYKRLMPSSTEQAGETQTEDGAYVLSADEKKKNLMNRLGEAVGTGRRIVAHPLTQGVVAGLAYGKSEDDPLYGLGKGVEWTQGKAKSDYYQRKIDPNSIPSIMGGYSEKDYNADTLSKYRDTMAEKNRQDAILAQRKQEYDENMKNQRLAEEQSMNTARINNWSEGNKLARERFEYQKKQDAEAKEEKRRKAEEEGLANGSLIRVVSPDGKTGIIPASEWKNAKKMGAKRI